MLDQGDADDTVAIDFSPGSDTEGIRDPTRRRLLEFALAGRRPWSPQTISKLQGAARGNQGAAQRRVSPRRLSPFRGHHPDYGSAEVAHHPQRVRRFCDGPSSAGRARGRRIAELVAELGQFVLVSPLTVEGINLQQHFDAVLLRPRPESDPPRATRRTWTASASRSREVRVFTYYGTDNPSTA